MSGSVTDASVDGEGDFSPSPGVMFVARRGFVTDNPNEGSGQMWISKRVVVLALASVAALFSMAVAVAASGADKSGGNDAGEPELEGSLAPSMPDDPDFHGVAPGGAPWVLDRGEVRLGDDELEVRVEGLVIPKPVGDGTAGPVKTISASLFCGADADTVPADTTRSASLSRDGDGRIRDRSFDVPDTCLAPVIVVHPNGSTAVYIAVNGWRA